MGGRAAERFARAFGTFTFIVVQTAIVAMWIGLNAAAFVNHWDPYPFILLNLCFSTQAAYAAPLILLARTRQATRDGHMADAQREHAEDLARQHEESIEGNTKLTAAVHELSVEIREHIAAV